MCLTLLTKKGKHHMPNFFKRDPDITRDRPQLIVASMALSIVEITKTQGSCCDRNLLEEGFFPEDIEKYGDRATATAAAMIAGRPEFDGDIHDAESIH